VRRFLRLAFLVALLGATASACYVRETRPGPPCYGGVWVEGHYGPRGRWHPAHWRCPGVREVY
jgi:hypothetical protein